MCLFRLSTAGMALADADFVDLAALVRAAPGRAPYP
jgi:hypothetical protein